MLIRWGKNHVASDGIYHALDMDNDDGNGFALCAKILIGRKATEFNHYQGISRSVPNLCKKCLKVVHERLNRINRLRRRDKK